MWVTILLGAAVASLVLVLLGLRRLALRRIAERSIRDPLTGAYTLDFIQEIYQAEIRRAERTGVPFSVAVVAIHDLATTLSRHATVHLDDVWVALARWLQSNLRGCDYVGRADADRFVLILPETWEDDARAVSKRISVSFNHHPKGMDREIPLTCDIGIATWTPEDADPWIVAVKQLEKLDAVARN